MRRFQTAIISALIVVFAYPVIAQGAKEQVSVTLDGAAGEVSGSLAIVNFAGESIMIDCGSFYEDTAVDEPYYEKIENTEMLNSSLPPNAEKVSAVIITHAHTDHCGRLPVLFEKGFNGPVFATAMTKELMRIMLASRIRYMQREADWYWSKKGIKGKKKKAYITAHWRNDCKWGKNIIKKNKNGLHGKITDVEKKLGVDINPCRECSFTEAERIIENVVTIEPNEVVEISPRYSFQLFEAGHIPGSAYVLVSIKGEKQKSKLLFSGDLGNKYSVFQDPPLQAPEADAVWLESTYGDRSMKGDMADKLQEFRKEIGRTVKSGGVVWIPAFALDRTQKVLYQISLAQREGLISEEVPVYCPSPTAKSVTEVYINEMANKGSGTFKGTLYKNNQLLPKKYVDNFKGTYGKREAPYILVTTSWIPDQIYRALGLKGIIENKDAGVFYVGYQSPGSFGWQLKMKQKQVHAFGTTLYPQLKANEYDVFSSHCGLDDAKEWLAGQKEGVSIYLVHGGKKELENRKKGLNKGGYSNISIAEKGQEAVIQ